MNPSVVPIFAQDAKDCTVPALAKVVTFQTLGLSAEPVSYFDDLRLFSRDRHSKAADLFEDVFANRRDELPVERATCNRDGDVIARVAVEDHAGRDLACLLDPHRREWRIDDYFAPLTDKLGNPLVRDNHDTISAPS